jgi:hypothetical protein
MLVVIAEVKATNDIGLEKKLTMEKCVISV